MGFVPFAPQDQVQGLKRTPPPFGGGVIGHGRSQEVAIPWPFRHSRRVVLGGSLPRKISCTRALPPYSGVGRFFAWRVAEPD